MKLWIVEWLVFNAPNGLNADHRKFFTSEKAARYYIDQLKEAARFLCVQVEPTVEYVEAE